MTRTESTKSQVTPNFDLPVDKFSDEPGYTYTTAVLCLLYTSDAADE